MLARIRRLREENEGGFTLIELLVVVVIIGILAAIAIPTFLNQREKAWQRAAQSDVRNAGVKMEEYFSDNAKYPLQAEFVGTYLPKVSEPGETITVVTPTNAAAQGTDVYCITVDHPKLNGTGAADYRLLSTVGRPEALAC